MIETEWLQRVLALAEADTGGIDADRLASLLSEPNEVLPYLFVHTRGFADWPLGRAALGQAAANVVRLRSTSREFEPAPPPASPNREALYGSLQAVLAHSSVRPDHDRGKSADAPDIGAALRLIGHVRSDERRGDDPPSLFINEN